MANTPSLESIMRRIHVAQQRFEQARLRLAGEELLVRRLAGDRSGKDIIAHVTFWDQRLLHALEPEDGPDAFRLAPPIIADIPYGEDWADVVNERISRLMRDRDLAEITAEHQHTRARLMQVLGSLSHHDVFDLDGLSAVIGIPFLPLLEGVYEHYEEHAADLEDLHRP
jgi:hypothetical protein